MSRRSDRRGLTMRSTRRIQKPPPTPPDKPSPPPAGEPSPALAKAAGELTSLATAIRACEACPRAQERRSFGTGFARAPVLLVKAAPSEDDLRDGLAFAAEAEPLGRAFDALSLPLAWVYGTTALRCGADAANLDDLKACAPHLLVEIEAVGPRVLVAFGKDAAEAIFALDGRCGLHVPEACSSGDVVQVRSGLTLIATEGLPEGVTDADAKRRLWRDLKRIPELLS